MVPRHEQVRLTFGLHFPHQRLIFWVAACAILFPPGWPSRFELALPLRGLRIGHGPARAICSANVVSVAPQAFDLLDYLIRNRERVVSKDDLINAIWNGRSVSDAALTTRLNVARSAIGDRGEEQRLIKTLPRKGFRFIGPVREEEGKSRAVPDSRLEPEKLNLALPDKPSIAVLPFENMGGERIIYRARARTTAAHPTATKDQTSIRVANGPADLSEDSSLLLRQSRRDKCLQDLSLEFG
jgi:DNA-binding winged helix-turn-helix (wHTH) protein